MNEIERLEANVLELREAMRTPAALRRLQVQRVAEAAEWAAKWGAAQERVTAALMVLEPAWLASEEAEDALLLVLGESDSEKTEAAEKAADAACEVWRVAEWEAIEAEHDEHYYRKEARWAASLAEHGVRVDQVQRGSR